MKFRVPVVAVAACGVLAGCSSSAVDVDHLETLGPGRDVAAASFDSLGGLKALTAARKVRAVALVTVYDKAGQAHVSRQRQTIDLPGGTIRATAATPQGTWRARAGADGKCSTSGTTGLKTCDELMGPALVTLSRLVRGPMGLLCPSVRATRQERVRVSGEDLIRLAVEDDPGGASAYYFEPTTAILRYVAIGPDTPGRDGMVAVYTYQVRPAGGAFPQRIRLVRIGEFALVGSTPVLEADYSEVSLR